MGELGTWGIEEMEASKVRVNGISIGEVVEPPEWEPSSSDPTILLDPPELFRFTCNFEQNESHDVYDQFLHQFAPTQKVKFTFPVSLWKRVVLWLIGMRPFPPRQHTVEGTIQNIRKSVSEEINT